MKKNDDPPGALTGQLATCHDGASGFRQRNKKRDMSRDAIIFQKTTFSYETMSVDLFRQINIHFPTGWTGIIGANGAGKTTLLHLATGRLNPDEGSVRIPGEAAYCRQRTDHCPEDLPCLIESTDRRASVIKDQLGLREEWVDRWKTLSHGERKRSQIAAALWKNPFILALDEPTNHVDTAARQIIISTLQRFRGIGLLVSHDRELLDALCRQYLFVKPPGVTMRDGTIDEGLLQEKREEELAARHYDETRKQLKKIQTVADGHRREASRSHQKRSKKGISAKDHDAKSKKDLARMSGKDGQSGRLLKQQSGKIKQMQERLDAIPVEKKYEMGVWQEAAMSRRSHVLKLDSRVLPMGEGRSLDVPPLLIKPDDRIGLLGLNGTGKSTLIKCIVEAANVPADKLIYMPQEIDAVLSGQIIRDLRSLPGEQLGHLMTIVNRLGTRPPRLLESDMPSPGEIRKTLLALGIVRVPQLIIMDEPTNHLDLPSIECLEEMLAGCPCALLLVSHDHSFLNRLIDKRWEIVPYPDIPDRFRLQSG